MEINSSQSPNCRISHPLFSCLIILLIGLIYSNSFTVSWQFDDVPNIVNNEKLHPSDLRLSSWANAMTASPDGKPGLYRPVVCLSFALNWFIHKDQVFGYHLVNLIIHMISAIFVYLCTLELQRTAKWSLPDVGKRHFIAGLATVFWAVHPIQTQAVTYIVQRMASMAAMFYILGCWLYLRLRRSGTSRRSRIGLGVGVAVCYLLALGSKENTVLFPIALVLMEVGFYSDLGWHGKGRRVVYFSAACGFLIIVVGAMFALGDPLYLLTHHAQRPFTPWQRLLTETRVMMLYFKQLFYPIPANLSLQHEMPISTSLIHPWTTLPCSVIVLLAAGMGLYWIRKFPLIGFAISFFFLNHLVESTILPLELVFEHRNYLPSMFLFVPVAMGFQWLLDYYRTHNPIMKWILVGFGILLIIGLGMGTYIRNMAWQSEKTLWQDVLEKAPNTGRPYQVLGRILKQEGRLDEALRFYDMSLQFVSQESRPLQFQLNTLNNMGNVFIAKGQYRQAVEIFHQALTLYPGDDLSRYNLVLAHIYLRQWPEALEHVDALLSINSRKMEWLNLKGFLLIKLGRPQEAVIVLKQALRLAPANRMVLTNLGKALMDLGQHQRADLFFRQALHQQPDNLNGWLMLVENQIRSGDRKAAEAYAREALARFPFNTIRNVLTRKGDALAAVHFSSDLLVPVFGQSLQQSVHLFGNENGSKENEKTD